MDSRIHGGNKTHCLPHRTPVESIRNYPMNIDLQIDFDRCVNQEKCETFIKAGLRGDPALKNRSSGDKESAICIIPESDQALLAQLKTKPTKNSAYRAIKKSEDKGFRSHSFNYFNLIDDIVEIHRSKTERGGKRISTVYREVRSKFGPKLANVLPDEKNVCQFHNITYWGLFEPEETSNSSTPPYNEKLISYIRAFRLNDFVWYNMIMGHGDYLKFGVMHRMHTDLLKNLINSASPPLYINYGVGNVEKNQWKRKALFQNVRARFDDLKIYNSTFDESNRSRAKKEIPKLLASGEYARAEITIRLLRYYPSYSIKSRIRSKIWRMFRT